MPSHFQLFAKTWANREDFPIELDVKYALIEIQSNVYANEHIHPFFYTLCDTINKHEKSIVKKSVRYLTDHPTHNLLDVVHLSVFESMIPQIIKYIQFCQRHNSTDSITQQEGGNYFSSLREAIYQIWMDELPHQIWLPFYPDHEAHQKYYSLFDTKIKT
jgi:hypothetical protein